MVAIYIRLPTRMVIVRIQALVRIMALVHTQALFLLSPPKTC